MKAPPRLPLLAVTLVLLVAPAALAGCFGKDDAAPQEDVQPQNVSENRTNVTNPEGFEQSSGFQETNKTEEGVGGERHTHDHWDGKQSIVVFDDQVELFPFPLFPDGDAGDAKSVAYVKLPAPNLVYEGTGRVDVLVGPPLDVFTESATHPAPPNVQVQYQTASSSGWSDPLDVQLDTPLEIPVDRLETDMPHSMQSLWAWRIVTDRPDWSELPLTITVHKDRDVEDWPGHPDFYANGPTRKIMSETVSTYMSGVAESWLLYGEQGTWVNPEFLISHGTTRLEVWINVTSTKATTGAEPTRFILEVHNATILGSEDRFSERVWDVDGTDDGKSYNFTVQVDHDGMDGPYQPQSRWGFRAVAFFADADLPTGGSIGLCPGCFGYEVDYTIDVIAINDDWVPTPGDEEGS